jgi:hypothetical protein
MWCETLSFTLTDEQRYRIFINKLPYKFARSSCWVNIFLSYDRHRSENVVSIFFVTTGACLTSSCLPTVRIHTELHAPLWYYIDFIENYASNNSFIVTCIFIAALNSITGPLPSNDIRIHRHTGFMMYTVIGIQLTQVPRYTYSEPQRLVKAFNNWQRGYIDTTQGGNRWRLL